MKWCVLAVVFAVPFSKSISEICISVAIVALILTKLVNSKLSLTKTSLDIPFLIFILTIIPSFFNTAYPDLSTKAIFSKVLKYVAFYYVIVETLDTKAKLKDLFAIVLLSIFVIALDGFGQYFYSGIDGLHNYPAFKVRLEYGNCFRGFPTACFPFPNDFAAWILLVFFPVSCVAMFGPKELKARWLTVLASAALFYLLFLTKVRGAWLGLSVSALYLAVSKKRLWIIAILALTLLMPFFLKMEMANYIFNLGSVGDRFFMWGTGWEIFKNHPIIGNGLNTFFRHFMYYRNDEWKGKKGSYAHNCYLQMASDTGVVGLAGFVFLISAYFVSIMRSLKRMRDKLYSSALLGISMGVLAFLILGFFDTNLYSLNLATLFWCAIGISLSIVRVCREDLL